MKEFIASVEELCNYLIGLSSREKDAGRKNELQKQCELLRDIAERLNGEGKFIDIDGFEECKTKLNSLNHFLRKQERRETAISVVIPNLSKIATHINNLISEYN